VRSSAFPCAEEDSTAVVEPLGRRRHHGRAPLALLLDNAIESHAGVDLASATRSASAPRPMASNKAHVEAHSASSQILPTCSTRAARTRRRRVVGVVVQVWAHHHRPADAAGLAC
jgi:hypothetical protein